MSLIHIKTQPVYFAPTARKTFITKRAAARAEARARILKKYPSERSEEDYPGWHWLRDLPKAEQLYRRYSRLIFKTIKS